MSVTPLRPERPEQRLAEAVERVIAYQRADIAGACEVPPRFADATVDELPPRVAVAIRRVLDTLPDARQEIATRVKAALEIGNPALSAQLDRRALVQLVSRAKPMQFVIIGPKGVGKTRALSALLNAARERYLPGRLASITSITADVQKTFDRAREERTAAVMQRYEDTPLLVLDDLDKVQVTDWSASFVYDLVNSRSERFLPTFTSLNLAPDEVVAEIKSKVNRTKISTALDRLRENAVKLSVSGESRR